MTDHGKAGRGEHASPAEWLEARGAAATRREVCAHFSRHALDRDLERGLIIRILPDTYVAAACAADFRTRASAALVWAGPGCALGGMSAVHLRGAQRAVPERVDLCAPPAANLRGPSWIGALQSEACGAATKVDGLACVPLGDALIQTWCTEGAGVGASVILDAVRAGRVAGPALAARAAAYPRIRDRRALARLLDALAEGAESYLEHVALTQVFNTRDFAGFTRQHRLRVSGRHYVVDMWHEEARVAVELDGRAFHGDDVARRRDLERDTDLASVGVVTVRFTFEDITGRSKWCRARLRAVLARRVQAAA